MANEDVLERFGWDGEEGLIFDRTKPFGDSTPEKGPLYEEVTTFDLIEIANALAAALREAREDTRRLDFLSEPTAILTVFDSGAYGSFGGRFIAADGTLRGLIDAAMKPPGGEGSGHE